MTLSRRVGSGATFQIAARLFSSTVSFIVTAVVLARVLPQAEYGRFSFYLTLFLLALQLVDFGVNRAAIRMITAGEVDRGNVLRAAVILKTGVGAIAFVAMAAIAFGSESSLRACLMLSLASAHALSHGMGAGSVPFEVDVDFKAPATSVVIGSSLFLSLGLVLAGMHIAAAEPYLVAWGIGMTAQNAWLWRRARRVSPPPAPVDRALLRRLAGEALPLGLSSMAIAVYFYSDTLLMRPLRGEEDVALYSAAYRLMSFALMVPVLGSQVLFPVFTRCHGKSNEILGKAVKRATFYFAYGAAAVGGVVLALAEPILGLVYGEAYRESATALRVLTLALMTVYLLYPHTTALIAAGRAKTFTAITVTAAILNVALNLVAIPRWGPLGAAATTLASEGFVFVAGFWCLRRATGVHGLSAHLAAAGVVFAATFLLLSNLAIHLPIAVLLAIGVLVPVVLAVPLRAWPFDLRVDETELA